MGINPNPVAFNDSPSPLQSTAGFPCDRLLNSTFIWVLTHLLSSHTFPCGHRNRGETRIILREMCRENKLINNDVGG